MPAGFLERSKNRLFPREMASGERVGPRAGREWGACAGCGTDGGMPARRAEGEIAENVLPSAKFFGASIIIIIII